MAERVEVTQADREAVRPFMFNNFATSDQLEAFDCGHYNDVALVQAFARHRIAAAHEARAEREVLREALQSIADRQRETFATADNHSGWCRSIARQALIRPITLAALTDTADAPGAEVGGMSGLLELANQ